MNRIALAVLLTVISRAAWAVDANPLQVAATHAGPPTYNPGQPVEITVTITASQPTGVTALGLRETIPDGWTFAGMRGITGDLPGIFPQQGTASILEFAWITIPPLPYSFAYTLAVPADATDTAAVTGQAEYRTTGAQQLSNPDIITMNGPTGGAPKITLTGGSTITLEQGQAFQEPGYTATDSKGNDLSGSVTTAGGVDSSTPGEYTITYTVRDGGGQTASATRLVTVVASTQNGGTTDGSTTGGTTTGGTTTGGGNLGGGSGVANRPLRGAGSNASNTTNVSNNRQNLASNTNSNATGAANRALPNAQAKNALGANGKPNPLGNLAMPTLSGSKPPMPKSGLQSKSAFTKGGSLATAKSGDDMKELDKELFGGDNTGEVATDASTSPPKTGAETKLASAATAAPQMLKAVAPPRVPGIFERIRMRIGSLSRREVATIFASLLAFAGLSAFAAIAGRIAYASPVRRPPAKPAAAE